MVHRIGAPIMMSDKVVNVHNSLSADEWRRELEALAQELGYWTTMAEELEAEFAAVVQRIVTPPDAERA